MSLIDTQDRFVNYTTDNYNTLTHIHDAMRWDLQKVATDLLKSIKQLGAFELVGVCRLHRHFDMNEGECVVSKIVDNEIRASVQEHKATLVPW